MAAAKTPPSKPSKIVVPVRTPAWLQGDLGNALRATLAGELRDVPEVSVQALPRGLLVQADEAPGVLLEAVERAARAMEKAAATAFPVLHLEWGGVWTGTLQAIFDLEP